MNSKKKCWKTLIKEIDEDTYGLGFKIAVKRIRPRKPIELDEIELRENSFLRERPCKTRKQYQKIKKYLNCWSEKLQKQQKG